MNSYAYQLRDPQTTDQELYQSLSSCFEAVDPFSTFEQQSTSEPILNIIDHPCGTGKTNTLIALINERTDLKFLIVVQTLDEVRRVLDQTTKGRLKSPEGPSQSQLTKGQQLEDFVVSGDSVVITHALYERAGALAWHGALRSYHVVIDEVPNAVSVLGKPLLLESFQEFYIDPGYCEMSASGMVSPTEKGIEQAERLKEVLDKKTMECLFSGWLFHDQKQNLIQTIPVYLFTEPLSVTVLTFMSEGTLFAQFLKKSEKSLYLLKTSSNADCQMSL